jgi:cytochrome P450
MIEQEAVSPILAGSDSTGALLRTIVLYVSTNTKVWTKLTRQIDEADSKGLLSCPPKLEEIKQHIPYLDCVIREALRMGPVVGGPLWRQVPETGVSIENFWLPSGTDIGFSQWAVARNKAIFGEDADLFRPERWSADVEPAARQLRDSGEIFFGGGIWLCSGRNVAMMELNKITAEFFRSFEVEIANPTKPLEETNALAMLHRNFLVKLTPRKANP